MCWAMCRRRSQFLVLTQTSCISEWWLENRDQNWQRRATQRTAFQTWSTAWQCICSGKTLIWHVQTRLASQGGLHNRSHSRGKPVVICIFGLLTWFSCYKFWFYENCPSLKSSAEPLGVALWPTFYTCAGQKTINATSKLAAYTS